ncbi:MFS transporter [Paenibacillus sp. LHD-38]|uniref:MFS transporter n=1 Tax=Paenibacillus sp. LHD-38 TaxID=3072143 RepID=UPI00280E6BD5|nr:MFS transporter [Paenibacillus sp. LHD-38]MDQ8735029.1 MFS transporter [Paenibacillus sp. LHD-38]
MFLTFHILATAFPLYVKDSLNGNQQQMGLVITIYVLGSVLIRPFSGQWVDRFGKKKMAVIGLVIFLIACICYFGSKGIFLFLVIRLIHGMSYAVASTATSTVASALVPDSRQGEGMGYFSMFMSIAMVVGPALGLFLWKDKNINVLLLAVCAIAALSLLFTMVMRMPQEKRDTAEPVLIAAPIKRKRGISWSDFIEPKALPISLVGFFLAFSYSSLSGFISSFTAEIHLSHVTGYFFVTFAIMIVLFRPMIGKVFDKYKEHYLYYPGILLFAIGMLLLSQAHSGTMVLASGVIMGIGYGALLPCFQTLALKLAPEHRRGSAAGTFFLLFDLGYGLGSYFMGLIASFTDYRMMYVVAGLITLLSVAAYYLLHHRPRAKLPIQNHKANIA